MRPLIIDSFAGGGGASEGIRAALGRDPDFALNHDAIALAMHRINHPDTHHIEEDEHRIAPHDFPAVEEDLGEMDRESALLAQTAHALALVQRLARDEQSGRPAPVAADAEPRSPSARGLLARAITALTGAPTKGFAA